MKFAISYNDKNVNFDDMIKEIIISHKGKFLGEDFFKGETTIEMIFDNEGNFENFFGDVKRLGSKFHVIVSKVGNHSIDL